MRGPACGNGWARAAEFWVLDFGFWIEDGKGQVVCNGGVGYVTCIAVRGDSYAIALRAAGPRQIRYGAYLVRTDEVGT